MHHGMPLAMIINMKATNIPLHTLAAFFESHGCVMQSDVSGDVEVVEATEFKDIEIGENK